MDSLDKSVKASNLILLEVLIEISDKLISSDQDHERWGVYTKDRAELYTVLSNMYNKCRQVK